MVGYFGGWGYFRVNTVFIYFSGIHKTNLYIECKKILQNTYNAKRNIYIIWHFFALARMLIRQFIQDSNPGYGNLLVHFKRDNVYVFAFLIKIWFYLII